MSVSETTSPSLASIDPRQNPASQGRHLALADVAHENVAASCNGGIRSGHIVALDKGHNGITFPQLH